MKAEIHHGLNIERSENLPENKYNISKSSLFGAKYNTYSFKEGDNRSFLDHLDSDYKPYLVALTLLVESPMKLYV